VSAPAIPEMPQHPLLDALLAQSVGTAEGQELLDNPPEIAYLESRRLGGGRFFYLGGVHIVAGHKKSGKSWLTTMQLLDHVEVGLPSVVLDFENGTTRFARRLLELGVRRWPEELHYLPFPSLPQKPEDWSALIMQLEDVLPGALVTIDSYHGLNAKYGFELGDPLGAELLYQPLLQAETLTFNILDHSKMSTKPGDKDVAVWNARKQQAATVSYLVTKTEPFSAERMGEIRLDLVDDRDGRLPGLRAWKIGGQGEGSPLHFARHELEDPEPQDA
jgi:hypothetical protein